MRKGIRHGNISHAIHATRCIKHGSKADKRIVVPVEGQHDPKFHKNPISAAEDIRQRLTEMFASTTDRVHEGAFGGIKAIKEATVNTTMTIKRCPVPDYPVPPMPRTEPGDFTPMKQHSHERLTTERMTVAALAKAVGEPIANVVAMMNNPDSDYLLKGGLPHFVKDGRSTMPKIVAQAVIDHYDSIVEAPDSILAVIDVEAPAKTAEQVAAESHLAHFVMVTEEGSGCMIYECNCGHRWTHHTQQGSCDDAEPMADWECLLLDVPLGSREPITTTCPARTAALALLAT
jgi:hypothetical protein